ncbi:1,4-alpha-glucan branching protein GlgB [Aureibaculum sp. A20]|uniref:1,4-alpha-glucan branching enzyme GlgB n=1 Tax=Aureibaculum flavum TaxID=2795986 RepID=A0ABS0WPP0_9FLAO|nr:1,4-alpha-glucan branching protein GlgB [Aureibaculum flavum]MBJ2173954.1 1,4-alpha-glucan branching protein GlgB [Aureibaculum flavum]
MTKVSTYSQFTDFDIALFKSGKHFKLYEKLGSHIVTVDGVKGTYFAVWAPSAKQVSVIGDFNFWSGEEHPLNVRWDASGIWEGFIPNVGEGSLYKYKIHSNHNGVITEKADPYAKRCEHPPKTASIVWGIDNYKWKDKKWMSYRKDKNGLDKPYSVYEVHLDSWMKSKDNERLTYRELAKKLVPYVKEMNFTHIELMPIMEYPYDPSWGYQLTGYFAPTSRFGTPQDFMYLVDQFHQNDIGVILDWVPSHFPSDDHGLGFFDGSHLYEHPDKRKGYHQDWKSLIFNYERNEVRSFLISNALFWLEKYNIDCLRVDAVASMLYLDYSREDGEWEPNIYGERENLAAVSLLKEFNQAVEDNFDGVITIAEESTAFPGVTRAVKHDGLGFGMKWMMGWMHDTLDYFAKDPIYRQYHQNDITFSLAYAFSENFMLPLSHDEVVYGKNSILGRMPGDEWQRFANLRLLYGYMFTHPGTNLVFMGGEFGQYNEWDFQKSLDWNLLEFEPHKNTQAFFKDLNQFYKNTPALYEKAFSADGFEWISLDDSKNCVLSYIRKGHDKENDTVVVCNFTPKTIEKYNIGLPRKGKIKEIFNSDSEKYGGSGFSNTRQITLKKKKEHNKPYSATIGIPPLGVVIFKYIS